MADKKDKKISDFELEQTLDGNELVPIVKDGVNYKTTLDDIRSGLATEERIEAVEEAQTEDLAKITELAGKLNGIDSVSAELAKKADITDVDAISAKIPSQASATNQLADKDFVNSSIATNTAEFKGTYSTLAELQSQAADADANDYGFVRETDLSGNTVYNRYKYVEGEGWKFEYALNNSSFTAAQWEAINSGVTANSFDALETLAESVNQGLGETIQRVSSLETSLAADKTNLANFKAHVEADFVKDTDYNNDKATLVGEIMKRAATTYVDAQDKSTLASANAYADKAIADTMAATPSLLDTLTQISERLKDDSDLATALTQQITALADRIAELEAKAENAVYCEDV